MQVHTRQLTHSQYESSYFASSLTSVQHIISPTESLNFTEAAKALWDSFSYSYYSVFAKEPHSHILPNTQPGELSMMRLLRKTVKYHCSIETSERLTIYFMKLNEGTGAAKT